MYSRDYRDIIGGVVVILFGVGFAGYSHAHYDFGTPLDMGPGMFPAGLGYLLMLTGVLIVVPALFRQGSAIDVDWWALLAISISLIVFLLTIDRFGLVPAVALTTIVSAFSEGKPNLVQTGMLTTFMVVFCFLVFKVGLGLQIPIARWPL